MAKMKDFQQIFTILRLPSGSAANWTNGMVYNNGANGTSLLPPMSSLTASNGNNLSSGMAVVYSDPTTQGQSTLQTMIKQETTDYSEMGLIQHDQTSIATHSTGQDFTTKDKPHPARSSKKCFEIQNHKKIRRFLVNILKLRDLILSARIILEWNFKIFIPPTDIPSDAAPIPKGGSDNLTWKSEALSDQQVATATSHVSTNHIEPKSEAMSTFVNPSNDLNQIK